MFRFDIRLLKYKVNEEDQENLPGQDWLQHLQELALKKFYEGQKHD